MMTPRRRGQKRRTTSFGWRRRALCVFFARWSSSSSSSSFNPPPSFEALTLSLFCLSFPSSFTFFSKSADVFVSVRREKRGGKEDRSKNQRKIFSLTNARAQNIIIVLITARKNKYYIIMASIVQSIHMSAKASVAKTESLKRQRSVKSVSRTSNVTFASSEETVDRRHAMSLFAVRKREMLFFLFFLSAIRLQNSSLFFECTRR